MVFEVEELCNRLASFPKGLMSKLCLIDANFLKDFDIEYDLLINDVIRGKQNSLYNADILSDK